MYDQFGMAAFDGSGGAAGGDPFGGGGFHFEGGDFGDMFGDIFGSFFGGGGRSQRGGFGGFGQGSFNARGRDMEASVTVDLMMQYMVATRLCRSMMDGEEVPSSLYTFRRV